MSWRSLLRPRFVASAASALALTAATSVSCEPQAHKSKITGKVDVGATRWLKLQTISYEDQTGRARKWDMASRTTKKADSPADAVAVLALLRHRNAPDAVEMLLVHQFRPPVNAVTVELPAGLIDPGESAETAALREVGRHTHACQRRQAMITKVALCALQACADERAFACAA